MTMLEKIKQIIRITNGPRDKIQVITRKHETGTAFRGRNAVLF